MNSTERVIKSVAKFDPFLYAYTLPGVPDRKGWLKIGYTTQSVESRIKQQVSQTALDVKLVWSARAISLAEGTELYIKDIDLHKFLERKGIHRLGRNNHESTEWFKLGKTDEDAEKNLKELFYEFQLGTKRKTLIPGAYTLRPEQVSAVDKAYNYFTEHANSTFLWNAKPRFGKTLAAYNLVQKAKFKHVLVVTQRPVIANSWLDDYNKFVAPNSNHLFVSDSKIFGNRAQGLLTRNDYMNEVKKSKDFDIPFIAFDSLQNIKGSCYFGGKYDKLKWMSEIDWDLLIIDEAHEGTDTDLAIEAFTNIKRKHTLMLSGTPFKKVSAGEFSEEQMFSWEYLDEQKAKAEYAKRGDSNPYDEMPQLNMLTYTMSPETVQAVNSGIVDEFGQVTEYAFSLNEFFRTLSNGTFAHENAIINFLEMLSTNTKYPFSTPTLREDLSHTIWLLDRVASVKALEKLLNESEVFKDYKIISAVGSVTDAQIDNLGLLKGNAAQFTDSEQSKIANNLDRVKKAIEENPKTITLSVGQLTTGVTVPEWRGIMMLSDIKSASLYMQAAFRVQSPWTGPQIIDGKTVVSRKENAYIFDFSPARTLTMFDEIANGLHRSTANNAGSTEERKAHIEDVLNFFPIIGEDEDGQMIELDPEKVLSIPRRYRAQNALETGFMTDDLLSSNLQIGRLFNASQELLDELNALPEESNMSFVNPAQREVDSVEVTETGEPYVDPEITLSTNHVLLGELKTVSESLESDIELSDEDFDVHGVLKADAYTSKTSTALKQTLKSAQPDIVNTTIESLNDHFDNLNSKELKKVVDTVSKEAVTKHERVVKAAAVRFENQKGKIFNDPTLSDEEKHNKAREIEATFIEEVDAANESVNEEISEQLANAAHNKAQETKYNQEVGVMRAKLRGFLRTIPMMLVAYGDETTTLDNFDDLIDEDLFKETTGLSKHAFRLLREGRINEEHDEDQFNGCPFDSQVFNDAAQLFIKKRDELERYFELEPDGTIFRYIPIQRTNLKYVPFKIAEQMLDAVEEESPAIFDNPTSTIADNYIKSGLFLMGSIRRLYKSEIMKTLYPDDDTRIKYILEHQIFGMAPTPAIYALVKRLIFGFDHNHVIDDSHIIQRDFLEE